jgi:hypothetical protein
MFSNFNSLYLIHAITFFLISYKLFFIVILDVLDYFIAVG